MVDQPGYRTFPCYQKHNFFGPCFVQIERKIRPSYAFSCDEFKAVLSRVLLLCLILLVVPIGNTSECDTDRVKCEGKRHLDYRLST